MNAMKLTSWLAASALTLGLCGCDLFVSERPREQPVIVEQQPVYVEPARREVIVEPAPPPVIDVHVH